MPLQRSWVETANAADSDFPLNNLPCGVFSIDGDDPRCGMAIGDRILDLAALEAEGLLRLAGHPVFDVPFWNEAMELGPQAWADLRAQATAMLAEGASKRWLVEDHLVPMADATLHLPFMVAEFTDFFSGHNHARNVARLAKSGDGALSPNWLHMPLASNGRASSVMVSGSDVRRPYGQLKPGGADQPYFGPSRRFDFELELGAVVGQSADRMLSVAEADAMIFGYVLLNDWSARDIQAWESQPLGPFQAKATATTISPWIVMAAALAPFRAATPPREVPLLPYLQDSGPMLYDIALEAALQPEGAAEQVISRTSATQLYYSAAQQLCQHSSSGCPMSVGDLLGSGTISGSEKGSYGSLLELSEAGQQPLTIGTATRRFLEDGDRVTLRGHAAGDGYRIGFGDCAGRVLPAQPLPDWAK